MILAMPQPPDWQVDWPALDRLPWIRRLAGCPQDAIHHAEGDVWIHTRMVCEALARLEGWRTLPPDDRDVVFAAAVMHDIAKPECTKIDADGRITSRGHSRRGAILGRRILWEANIPFELRERVCGLVRFHQVPYFLVERADAQRQAMEVSQSARCDHLALLAEADVRGRVCGDQQRLLDNIGLFREYCQEQGCLTGARPFLSEHARFLYFRSEGRYPDVPTPDEFRCEVIVLSGLPGSGKDHWIRRQAGDWPVISLDDLREELDIEPTDNQGALIQAAREKARELLRAKQSFVWNATNLSRQVRGQCIDLLAKYDARVRVVYVETSRDHLFGQNRRRERRVPVEVIEHLLGRWEVPDLTEAHRVEYVVDG